jgi:CelD/BcsL family acetyltransferase involved in cellulose biosynthesis
MTPSAITTRLLNGFDDATFGRAEWQELLRGSDIDHVFLTWEWNQAWWKAFGRGTLLLVVAAEAGRVRALAPLYADGGMVFVLGSGLSDYLDLVGTTSSLPLVEALLTVAMQAAPDFVGFRFYHLLEHSPTTKTLAEAAPRLGLDIVDEGELVAPALSVAADPDRVRGLAAKSSLRRRERGFERESPLHVIHARSASDVEPHLDRFFDQHIARRAATDHPSVFLTWPSRDFYRCLIRNADRPGWVRFTRVLWKDSTIAHHLGFCYRGWYAWHKPTFDVTLARKSPGEVLLRHLLLAAVDEGATVFDFGLGDEAFKMRFADHVNTVRTWGLYPR